MVSMNFQVVWGKVKGYPWWPAVIDLANIETRIENDKTQTKLKFIGENTQYRLVSAFLSSKCIQDFQRNLHKHNSTNNKVKSSKHLQNCIDAAQELAEGKLDFCLLKEINQRLIKSKGTAYVKIYKEIEPKISELKRLISHHDRIDLEPAGFDTYKHYEKILSEISKEKSIETNIQQLCEVLIELAKKKINKKMLKKSEIENLLINISRCCSDSPFQKVKEMGNHVLNLKGTWEKHKKAGGIVDHRLRAVVCRKIAFVLQVNGFNTANAREVALEIEEKLRKLDPSMEISYRKCFQRMIRDIKFMKYEDYLNFKVQLV